MDIRVYGSYFIVGVSSVVCNKTNNRFESDTNSMFLDEEHFRFQSANSMYL